MFKTLFNIIIIVVGFVTSVHANDLQLFSSDIEQSASESSDEVYAFSPTHHQFIDVQKEQFSVVSNVKVEPSPSEEISVNNDGLFYRSNQLFTLQYAQFVRAERDSIIHIHLRAILFPFHSFW
ncbi:hypothetical protein [Winogradskyella thalassocola]|uniref:Uncharacterized protein n=1 Tax=Winogradskyella thalassocola TaxID=262004 RepID=A0A1G7YXJ2_9FLAO|nr:hypothetical protein [Winogradskyella thalassocola]SDH01248.1 hypothetical protein SAMN04489796_1011165 [Winogradskyella thalassocola]